MLAVLGLIHAFWAWRGVSGRSVAVPERAGRPLFAPSRGATLAVAGGLFGGALTLLAQAGLIWLPVPPAWPRWGAFALASVFALRAVGEFRYVGLFKQVRGTRFARWDTRLFTPLCIVMALGSTVTATGAGPED
jgi:hypothetical protein